MAADKTTLIIPVEGQSRELDAKLLLACVAAERGFSAILGSNRTISREIAQFPRGIYLAKDIRKSKNSVFRILESLGHVIAACDEESLVRASDEDYCRRRLSPRTAPRIAHLFAWGDDDARVFRNYPHLANTQVHVTGNPRIDLLRPGIREIFGLEVAEIREKYGRFILINTNFDHANNLTPGKYLKGKDASDPEYLFLLEYRAHQQALFAEFRPVIPVLASAFSDLTIIIRPHPGEDAAAWRKVSHGLANVRVVQEKGVAPWLIAAEVVVHNGCTTAVEAAVLGTESVAYCPVANKRFDYELPNSVSIRTHDVAELCTEIRNVVTGQTPSGDARVRRKVLDRHIAPRDGRLAAERMVDVFCNAGYGDREFGRPALRKRIAAHRSILGRKWKRWKNSKRGSVGTHDPGAGDYSHRFPGTTEHELLDRIEKFAMHRPRFERLSAVRIADQVFRIEAATPSRAEGG